MLTPTLGLLLCLNASAKTTLERAYELDAGDAMARDVEEAAKLYREAAGTGDAFASLRLGYLHEYGEGVPQSFEQARQWYVAAAAAGLPEAHLRLAMFNLEGWGGPVDRDAFVRELRFAAEADYSPAQRIIANLYFIGFHVEKDRALGLSWLERAALQDDVAAQYDLGKASERVRSLVGRSDMELAREWYQLSAEQEFLDSMLAMSRTFLKGPSETKDWDTAKRWLELADELGDAQAPFTLAIYALRNPAELGIELPDARVLLERAADRGHSRAKEVMSVAEMEGVSLTEAARYVFRTPIEDRYVRDVAQKFADRHDESDRPPQVIRMISPIYPMSLRMTETNGEAIVRFVVDVKGRVIGAEVESATHPQFGINAVEAVRQWRFLPGKRNGRLVNMKMRVPVPFYVVNERLSGVDSLIGMAKDLAERLGGQAMSDAQDIRLAKARSRWSIPEMSDGQPPDRGSRCMLLLVLDERGHPVRGHVLYSKPEEVGPAMLKAALDEEFEPRELDGEPVSGSVLWVFQAK